MYLCVFHPHSNTALYHTTEKTILIILTTSMLAQDFLENFNNQLILKPATGLAGPNPCFDMMSSLDSKKGKVDHA